MNLDTAFDNLTGLILFGIQTLDDTCSMTPDALRTYLITLHQHAEAAKKAATEAPPITPTLNGEWWEQAHILSNAAYAVRGIADTLRDAENRENITEWETDGHICALRVLGDALVDVSQKFDTSFTNKAWGQE